MMNDTHPEPQPAVVHFRERIPGRPNFHDDDQETQLNDVDFDANTVRREVSQQEKAESPAAAAPALHG